MRLLLQADGSWPNDLFLAALKYRGEIRQLAAERDALRKKLSDRT